MNEPQRWQEAPGNIKTSLVTVFFLVALVLVVLDTKTAPMGASASTLHQFSCKVYFTERSSDSQGSAGKNAEEILFAFRCATSVPSLKDSRTAFRVN